MTYRARRLLFWLCIIFFAIAAAPLILYAFGWRIIWSEGTFARTGGLFVSSIPSTETKIFIDGKLRKETSLLSHSLFLGRLNPGFHQVRVAREGYHEWNKTIFVKPEFVSELKALLVSRVPQAHQVLRNTALRTIRYLPEEKAVVLGDITNHWFRFDGESLVFAQQPAGSAASSEEDARLGRRLRWSAHEMWVSWDPQHLPHYQSFEMEQILQTPYEIRSAAFYPRRDAVLVALSNAVMVVELDGRGGRVITPLYKGKEPSLAIDSSDRILYILDDGILIRIPLQ